MRHSNSGRKLSRTPSHRKALLQNLAKALITHGRIRTTELKAKELVIDELELLDLHLPEQGLISPHADEVAKMAREDIHIKDYGRDKETYEIAEATNIDIEHLSYLQIRVVCSKGTYIRALARDIGQALCSGAYLIGLRRTRVGDIRVEDCLPVENIEQWCYTVPIAEQPTK